MFSAESHLYLSIVYSSSSSSTIVMKDKEANYTW